MPKTLPLQQLITSTKQLMENNQQLVKTNAESSDLLEKPYNRQEKILICFGQVYQLINTKKDKTWEEEKCLAQLLALITYAEE